MKAACVQERIAGDGKVRYRAQVRVAGAPHVTRTFEYREDAEAWVAAKKAVIKERQFQEVTTVPFIKTGVYVLFRVGECVYVGSSFNDVYGRIAKAARRMEFDSFRVIPTPEHELLATEYRLIADLKPAMNVVGRRPAGRALEAA